MGPDQYYQKVGNEVVNDLNNKNDNTDAFQNEINTAIEATKQAIDSGEIDGTDEEISDYMQMQMEDAFDAGKLGNMSKDDFYNRLSDEQLGDPTLGAHQEQYQMTPQDTQKLQRDLLNDPETPKGSRAFAQPNGNVALYTPENLDKSPEYAAEQANQDKYQQYQDAIDDSNNPQITRSKVVSKARMRGLK